MDIKLLLEAIVKFLLGLIMVALLFLTMPLILGSVFSFLLFLIYPIILAKRIQNEEKILEKDLTGYKEYQEKVKYKLIPFIW